MRADFGEKCGTFTSGINVLPQKRWNQILRQRGPCAFDPFTAVERIFADDAFSPAVDSLAVHGNKKDATAVEMSETRLEKMDERHVNFTESDGFDFHWNRNALIHHGGMESQRTNLFHYLRA